MQRSFSLSWTQQTAIDQPLQGSAPAVGDDHVYLGDMGGQFYALSRADGSLVWSRQREGALTDSSALCQDGRIYIGSGGGTLYAFGPDGAQQWSYDGDSAVAAAPAATGDAVVFARNDGSVLAFGADTGTLRWEATTEETLYSAISYSAAQNAVYVTTETGKIHAFDVADGTLRWTRQFGAEVGASPPTVDDDRGVVYFATSELLALDAETGRTRWGTSFYGANAGSAPAFDETHVYAAGADGRVYGIARPDGPLATAPDWTFDTWDVSVVGNLVVADGLVFVVSLDGSVYVLETTTGDDLCSLDLDTEVRASPAVTDATVYIGSSDGNVFAVD